MIAYNYYKILESVISDQLNQKLCKKKIHQQNRNGQYGQIPIQKFTCFFGTMVDIIVLSKKLVLTPVMFE